MPSIYFTKYYSKDNEYKCTGIKCYSKEEYAGDYLRRAGYTKDLDSGKYISSDGDIAIIDKLLLKK